MVSSYYDGKKMTLDEGDNSNNFLIDYFKSNPSHMRLLSTFILKTFYSYIDSSQITDLTHKEREKIDRER